MPLSSAALAELVNRARSKAPPVITPSPPAPRPVYARPATPPAPQAPATPPVGRAKPQTKKPAVTVESPRAMRPLPQVKKPAVTATPMAYAASAVPTALVEHVPAADDFPTGWELRKESWHFHRRFYAIFKRAMAHGEYSQLLWQIRRRTAEHLWEDCWRVTLQGSTRTLAVRATHWQLITILPKNWQPPVVV